MTDGRSEAAVAAKDMLLMRAAEGETRGPTEVISDDLCGSIIARHQPIGTRAVHSCAALISRPEQFGGASGQNTSLQTRQDRENNIGRQK